MSQQAKRLGMDFCDLHSGWLRKVGVHLASLPPSTPQCRLATNGIRCMKAGRMGSAPVLSRRGDCNGTHDVWRQRRSLPDRWDCTRENDIKRTNLQSRKEPHFFRRGEVLARLADAGQPLPLERTISFEDPADLLRLLTARRLALFRCVKAEPDSITAIAGRLHRDRHAVKRDIDQLVQAGLLKIEAKTCPGHGRIKEIRAAAGTFRVETMVR